MSRQLAIKENRQIKMKSEFKRHYLKLSNYERILLDAIKNDKVLIVDRLHYKSELLKIRFLILLVEDLLIQDFSKISLDEFYRKKLFMNEVRVAEVFNNYSKLSVDEIQNINYYLITSVNQNEN